MGITAAAIAVTKNLRSRKKRRSQSHAAAAASGSAGGSQVTLAFEGVHCSITSKKGGTGKVILDNVSGTATPGR